MASAGPPPFLWIFFMALRAASYFQLPQEISRILQRDLESAQYCRRPVNLARIDLIDYSD